MDDSKKTAPDQHEQGATAQETSVKQDTPWANAGEGAPEATSADEKPDSAAEAAQLRDQLLRTLADMENLRRRTEREVQDARTYAVANFARDMLSVGDNLRRALEALPEDARNSGDATLSSLLDGVEMTERELLNTLGKHKVRRIEPLNERFDPNFHQAMFEVPNPEVPSGTVVQMVQAGYVIGDRVLRPALVGVSKGGPKPAPKPAEPKAEEAAQETAADQAAQPEPPHSSKPRPGEQTTGTHVDKSA